MASLQPRISSGYIFNIDVFTNINYQVKMTDKFRNKYRISSARMQHWNYGAEGSYFITICTNNRKHYFGEIKNDKMYLSEIGKIVETEWLNTFTIRADMNLEPGEFIVIPNHFHAIIIIGNNEYNQDNHPGGYGTCRDAMHGVSTTTNIIGIHPQC